MTNLLNFTKSNIQSIPIPAKGKVIYKDTKEKALSLYVTSNGVVSFFVRKRIHSRDERFILGHFPEMSIENARKQSLNIKAQIAEGIDPNEDKRRMRAEITFHEMFTHFMERYSKIFKKSWQYDEREVNKFLQHWFKRKASHISKQEIQQLHDTLRKDNGLYQANRVLERIRAIYNKAIEWGWGGVNPTLGIKKFKEKSRDRFIQPDELPKFFVSLEQELNQTIKDYFHISILTGARKSNLLAMRWKDLCFNRSEWKIPETKNGDSHNIPLIEEAIDILNKRKELYGGAEYVFPGEGKSGHLEEPRKGWLRILKRAGVNHSALQMQSLRLRHECLS